MTYKVIRRFADTTDRTKDFPNGHEYEVGDVFPRPGFQASDDWCRKLLTGDNTTGSIFIQPFDLPPGTNQEADVDTPPTDDQEQTQDENLPSGTVQEIDAAPLFVDGQEQDEPDLTADAEKTPSVSKTKTRRKTKKDEE